MSSGQQWPSLPRPAYSRRGEQYACGDYVDILKANKMVASISRPANPYDNAACESFMKTLKQEEIYCNQYLDFDDLSAGELRCLTGSVALHFALYRETRVHNLQSTLYAALPLISQPTEPTPTAAIGVTEKAEKAGCA